MERNGSSKKDLNSLSTAFYILHMSYRPKVFEPQKCKMMGSGRDSNAGPLAYMHRVHPKRADAVLEEIKDAVLRATYNHTTRPLAGRDISTRAKYFGSVILTANQSTM